ncbi:MAG TPA: glycosyltransferase family 39 protein [Pseudolysinimonas sp.]
MTSTIAADPRVSSARPGRHPLARHSAALIGVAGGALSMVGIGVPSFWGDEAASVISAERPISSLLHELVHVDAVHGLYYLLLHFWIDVAGASEAAVRFPSAMAAGFAIAGTVALGRELFGTRVAIVAGLVAMVIPELTRMAIEGRSYAIGMAAAVWLTWLLVRLIRRGETRTPWWAVYAIGTGLSVVLFMYLGFIVLVHLVVLVVERPPRRVVQAWLESLLVATAVALPLVVLAMTQQAQIAFLAHRHYATFTNVVVRQWFRTWYVAAIEWGLILAGVATTVRRRWDPSARRAAIIVGTWLLVPTALLLAGNAWFHPMYNMRYVAFCVPAVALAIGIGIDGLAALARLGRLGVVIRGALVLALVLACVPSFVAQRTPYAKDGGSDLRQIAQAVSAHASAGDAIVFDQSVKPRLRPRLAMDLYPADFAAVDDIALLAPAAERAGLWDRVAPLDTIGGALVGHRVVWAVESKHSRSSDLDVLRRLGYRVIDTFHLHRTVLYELTKEPT